ncbi:hypothetical protein ES692_06015 [Psychroserpens burtonensis]|uniref:Uncharacterized protein n=1 Tax=Psychroserpens burtonensis TaxID=49278 RepID=A0A5C7B8I6_9FLAO|nr:hypothetical protein [Psychroserpens burtonensis]TXE18596.1 hypothetical protein ES692_06015 [Psychroserpens burtonensis]
MLKFQEILKKKRDYYGHTEAAIEFAAEEFSKQEFKIKIHAITFDHIDEIARKEFAPINSSIRVWIKVKEYLIQHN